jgi:hypothetical protein
MKTYISSMSNMYANALTQNGMLFDIAMQITGKFRSITPEAIRSDSRIIKILRYCVAPSISQMKFGQLFGLSSTDPFEREKVVSGARVRELISVAPKIADFVADHFDRTRFIWIDERLSQEQLELSYRYAKNWTCALIADQNAQTEYRNWRKTLQETRIEHAVIALGYVRSDYSGDIRNRTDINVGTFTKERRVHGRTVQKADMIVHSKNGQRLILIEAKAIGVELDAYKRVKECCDKASDWKNNKGLVDLKIVAVVAGFLSETNIETLQKSGVSVVWEHDIAAIEKFLA